MAFKRLGNVKATKLRQTKQQQPQVQRQTQNPLQTQQLATQQARQQLQQATMKAQQKNANNMAQKQALQTQITKANATKAAKYTPTTNSVAGDISRYSKGITGPSGTKLNKQITSVPSVDVGTSAYNVPQAPTTQYKYGQSFNPTNTGSISGVDTTSFNTVDTRNYNNPSISPFGENTGVYEPRKTSQDYTNPDTLITPFVTNAGTGTAEIAGAGFNIISNPAQFVYNAGHSLDSVYSGTPLTKSTDVNREGVYNYDPSGIAGVDNGYSNAYETVNKSIPTQNTWDNTQVTDVNTLTDEAKDKYQQQLEESLSRGDIANQNMWNEVNKNGWTRLWRGVADYIQGEVEEAQVIAAKNAGYEDMTPEQQKAYEIASTTGNMVPTIVLGAAGAGAAGAGTFAGLTAQGWQNTALGLMGAGAGNQAYYEAKNAGLDENKAQQYGFLKGAIEVATERMVGYNPAYGVGELDETYNAIADSLVPNDLAANALLKYFLNSGLGEGVEEAASEFLGVIPDQIMNPDDKRSVVDKLVSVMPQALESAKMGALSGLAMGMGQVYGEVNNAAMMQEVSPELNSQYKGSDAQYGYDQAIMNQYNNEVKRLAKANVSTMDNAQKAQTLSTINAIEQENGGLTEDLVQQKSDIVNDLAIQENRVTRDFLQKANQLMKRNGYTVILDNNIVDERGQRAEGYIDNNTRQIVIDPFSDVNNAWEILAHEVEHSTELRPENAQYQQAINTLAQEGNLTNENGSKVNAQSIREQVENAYNPSLVESENAAVLNQALMGNEQAIDSLMNSSKISTKAKNYLSKLLGIQNDTSEQSNVQRMFENTFNSRDAWANPELATNGNYSNGIETEQDNLRPDGTRRDLQAVHNISSEKLESALKLGAFPMPSIAVTKDTVGHDGFGNISLLFDKSTIDPSQTQDNKIYDRDAWTPTYPTVDYEISGEVANEIENSIKSIIGAKASEALELNNGYFTSEDYDKKIKEKYGNVVESVARNAAVEYAYLKSIGKDAGFVFKNNDYGEAQAYVREKGRKYTPRSNYSFEYELNKAIEEKSSMEDYYNWINEKFSGLIKNKGIRKDNSSLKTESELPFDQTHVEENTENVLDYMKKSDNTSDVEKKPRSGAFANMINKSYDSIDEVIADEGKIKNGYEKDRAYLMKSIDNTVRGIAESKAESMVGLNSEDYLKKSGEIQDALYKATYNEIRNSNNSRELMDNINNGEYGVEIDKKQALALYKLKSKILGLPTRYFEAKPERAVGIDEVKEAVVPNTKWYDEIAKTLEDRGIKVSRYDEVKSGDRQAKINDREDLKFSKGLTTDDGKLNVEEIEKTVAEEGIKAAKANGIDIVNDEAYKKYVSEEVADQLRSLVEKGGKFTRGENPAVEIAIPKVNKKGTQNQQFARTIAESNAVAGNVEFERQVLEAIVNGDFEKTTVSNAELIEKAKNVIERDGFKNTINTFLASKDISANNVALGEVLLEYSTEINDENFLALNLKVSNMLSENGHALQAGRILKRLTPAGQMLILQSNVNSINNQIAENFKNKKSPVEINKQLAQEYIEATTEEQRGEIMDKINRDIAKQIPSTMSEKINQWRYLAMLANPRTHVRNIVGNAVFQPVVGTKNVINYGLQKAAQRMGIIDKVETSILNPTSAKDRALVKFGSEDFANVKGDFQQDQKYQINQDIIANRDYFSNKNIVGKGINAVAKFNNSALDMEDELFSKYRYARNLAQQMKAAGVTAETITDEQLSKFREKAYQEAMESVYRDFSATANAINKARNSSKGAKIFIDAVMPFTKTPMNIVSRMIEYSPVGLAATIAKIKQVRDGKMTATQYINNISKGVTGSGIVALGYLLASLGMFRVGDDDKSRKNNYESDLGEQDYALVMPDGSTYTIDWAAPAIAPLAIGAQLYNAVTGEGGPQFSDTGDIVNDTSNNISTVLDAAAGILDPITETSMLSGLSDSLSTYSGNKIAGVIGSAATSYVGQFFPTLGGQVARVIDDTRRSSYDNNTIASNVRKITNKIPFLSMLNEPYLDKTGEEVKQEDLGMGAAGRAILNMLSPGYYKSNTADEYDSELLRLYNANPDDNNNVIPTSYRNTTLGGTSYKFDAQESTEWNKLYGSTQRENVEAFIDSPVYSTLTDEERASIITKMQSYSQQVAKQNYFDNAGLNYTPDKNVQYAQEAANMGLDVYQYYIGTSFTSIKDDSGETIRNSQAMQSRDYWERLGVYDDIVQMYQDGLIETDDLKSAWGLNKTVINMDDATYTDNYQSLNNTVPQTDSEDPRNKTGYFTGLENTTTTKTGGTSGSGAYKSTGSTGSTRSTAKASSGSSSKTKSTTSASTSSKANSSSSSYEENWNKIVSAAISNANSISKNHESNLAALAKALGIA